MRKISKFEELTRGGLLLREGAKHYFAAGTAPFGHQELARMAERSKFHRNGRTSESELGRLNVADERGSEFLVEWDRSWGHPLTGEPVSWVEVEAS